MVFAGSYPVLYFVPDDDKDIAIKVPLPDGGMYTEDSILNFLEDNVSSCCYRWHLLVPACKFVDLFWNCH